MTRPLVATLAANAHQSAGACQAYTFPSFDVLVQHLTALLDTEVANPTGDVDDAKKSLPAFSAGQTRDKRANASCIVLDLDEFPQGQDFDDTVRVVQQLGLRAFAHESPGSRLKPGPKRGRLLIATDRDLTPDETRRIGKSLIGKIPGVSTAIGAGRINFLGRIEGQPARERHDLPGMPFPVDGWLATLPPDAAPEMSRAAIPDRAPTQTEIDLAEQKLRKELDFIATAPPGQKHYRLVQGSFGIGKTAWAMPHRKPEDLHRMVIGALARADSTVLDWAGAETTAWQCLERGFAVPDADLSLHATILDTLAEQRGAGSDGTPQENEHIWGDDIFDPIPGERYSIQGLHISAGSRFTLFSGPPGCGKSYAVADMLFALATGGQIWQRFEGVKGNTPVHVLHLDWEQGVSQVRRRYQEIALGRKTKPQGTLHYVRPRDWFLNSQGGIERLRDLLIQTGAKVCVIDCLRAAVVGLDENDSRYTEPLRAGLGALTDELGVDFIVLHHAKKDGTGIRGSGDIEGACGEHFEFKKDGDEVTVKHARTQTEPAFSGTMTLRLVRTAPVFTAAGIPDLNAPVPTILDAREQSQSEVVQHVIAKHDAMYARVMSVVRELEKPGTSVEPGPANVAEILHVPKTTIGQVLLELVRHGSLFQHGTGTMPSFHTYQVRQAGPIDGVNLPDCGPPPKLVQTS